MANFRDAWDISSVSSREGKKQEAEERARAIAARLSELRPPNLSYREWTMKAGVSSSFFTNLRSGSEPTVGNLRAVLDVIDVTLAGFFAHEVQGRIAVVPSKQALKQALRDAMPGLPQTPARRVQYLADTVERVLQLLPAVPASLGQDARA